MHIPSFFGDIGRVLLLLLWNSISLSLFCRRLQKANQLEVQ